ncbi:hypothetical protein L1987_32705 [Smallanthus sonchifolius]|uniref:Uncharacterized protein n=1 Tax=Smallanthus sonchifolius TaxID=185202 RepID=A0ACB9HQ64_9ASTR|nr:hypothetical protein L1987_32705 [Smallanthus sonchifolius]
MAEIAEMMEAEEREASVADQRESTTAVALMAIGEESSSSTEVDSNSFAVISCSKCLGLKDENSKLQDKVEPLRIAALSYKENVKRYKDSIQTLKKEKREFSLKISEQQFHLDVAYKGLEKRNNEITKLQNEVLQLNGKIEKLKNSRFVVEHYESVVRHVNGLGLGTNVIPPPVSGKFVNGLIDIDLSCLDESSSQDDSSNKDDSSSKADSASNEKFFTASDDGSENTCPEGVVSKEMLGEHIVEKNIVIDRDNCILTEPETIETNEKLKVMLYGFANHYGLGYKANLEKYYTPKNESTSGPSKTTTNVHQTTSPAHHAKSSYAKSNEPYRRIYKEKRDCFHCGMVGHILVNFPTKNQGKRPIVSKPAVIPKSPPVKQPKNLKPNVVKPPVKPMVKPKATSEAKPSVQKREKKSAKPCVSTSGSRPTGEKPVAKLSKPQRRRRNKRLRNHRHDRARAGSDRGSLRRARGWVRRHHRVGYGSSGYVPRRSIGRQRRCERRVKVLRGREGGCESVGSMQFTPFHPIREALIVVGAGQNVTRKLEQLAGIQSGEASASSPGASKCKPTVPVKPKKRSWNKKTKSSQSSSPKSSKDSPIFDSHDCELIEGHPKGTISNRWYVDSGCSRHMTCNMALLQDIKPFRGGHVAFAEFDSILWHRKLGHISYRKINHLVQNGLVTGVPKLRFSVADDYMPCKKGKQQRKSHKPKLQNSIDTPLELLHMDLFGPISIRSIRGKSYCVVVTNDFSRFTWAHFLGTKDETAEILQYLILSLESLCKLKVRRIRSDNGTEFKNNLMELFCLKKGIHHKFSAPYTPQQNGVAERKNRTLIETARTMLLDAKLPVTFWAEAVNTACHDKDPEAGTSGSEQQPSALAIVPISAVPMAEGESTQSEGGGDASGGNKGKSVAKVLKDLSEDLSDDTILLLEPNYSKEAHIDALCNLEGGEIDSDEDWDEEDEDIVFEVPKGDREVEYELEDGEIFEAPFFEIHLDTGMILAVRFKEDKNLFAIKRAGGVQYLKPTSEAFNSLPRHDLVNLANRELLGHSNNAEAMGLWQILQREGRSGKFEVFKPQVPKRVRDKNVRHPVTQKSLKKLVYKPVLCETRIPLSKLSQDILVFDEISFINFSVKDLEALADRYCIHTDERTKALASKYNKVVKFCLDYKKKMGAKAGEL